VAGLWQLRLLQTCHSGGTFTGRGLFRRNPPGLRHRPVISFVFSFVNFAFFAFLLVCEFAFVLSFAFFAFRLFASFAFFAFLLLVLFLVVSAGNAMLGRGFCPNAGFPPSQEGVFVSQWRMAPWVPSFCGGRLHACPELARGNKIKKTKKKL
jgi:hypothetical protein